MHIISVFLTHRKAEKGKEPKVVTHRPQPSALTGDAATVTRIPEKASVFSLKRKGKQVCARMFRRSSLFFLWLCLGAKSEAEKHCSTFRLYVVNIVLPWAN